jgi:hypothetical protein
MEAHQPYNAYFDMPVPPSLHTSSSLFSESRPRAHYCWLHGWNNSSHPGVQCQVMARSDEYTNEMRLASGPLGTGGNPKIGVPVSFVRPSQLFPPLNRRCPPTPPLTPTLHPSPAMANNETREDKTGQSMCAAAPNEDPFSLSASPASLHKYEGYHASLVRETPVVPPPQHLSTDKMSFFI